MVTRRDAIFRVRDDRESQIRDSLKFGRVIDAGWLLLLVVFVLAGVRITSYHTDETAHIFNSRDFAAVFLRGDLASIPVTDPSKDLQTLLRLLDSSVSRYTIGLAWYLSGRSESELPIRPYTLRLTWAENRADGRLPTDEVLYAGRMASALFLAGSVVIMFALGNFVGGRPLAYFASFIYTVNPIVLLNGRRAMQEGSLMCFGLLTILVAAHICRRRDENDGRLSPLWWAAVVLSSALCLSSKNSGLLYVAAALLWIFAADCVRRFPKIPFRLGAILALCAALIVALYVAFAPGLWANPLQRLYDVADLRARETQRLINNDMNAPSPLSWRVENLFIQPYIAEVWHFESPGWYDVPEVMAQVEAYNASPLRGLPLGVVLGAPMMALAVIGFAAMLIPRLRPPVSSTFYIGVPIWLAAVAASLIGSPLPWQRYFLLIIPIYVLLSGMGIYAIVRAVQLRRAALPTPTERQRYALALGVLALAVTLYIAAGIENRRLAEPVPLGASLPRTFAALLNRMNVVPSYRVRLSIDSVNDGETFTVWQKRTRLVEVGADYFCLSDSQVATGKVCYPYNRIRHLVLPEED